MTEITCYECNQPVDEPLYDSKGFAYCADCFAPDEDTAEHIGYWYTPKGDHRYVAPQADDSGWDGEALAGEIVRDRLALAAAVGLTADDVLNEDIEVVTERIAEIVAENERHETSTQSLIAQRNSLLNDEVKIHALLARVDWSIDEDVVTCVAGLVDEVAKLRAERDALKAALKPFAALGETWHESYPNGGRVELSYHGTPGQSWAARPIPAGTVTLGDLRTAARALKAEDTNGA